ncbi:MAG: preprotein translocase subunit SecA, partial [Candidatus Cloacimonetes bacterium]|nr:preprotein translocase subunit SecA [Candidatus Cloacimonadota bacterium]
MFQKILNFFFKDPYAKEIQKIEPIVEAINREFAEFATKTDDELRQIISDIKAQVQAKITPCEQELESLMKKYQEEVDEGERDKVGTSIDRQKELLKETTTMVLDENLITVFAVVKDTCRRLYEKNHKYQVRGHEMQWDMIPFDVQLLGGIVLHQGNIAEMATGEGKTLVATLPLFLNSLTGRGVHIITVNDYLAQRDAEWMNPIFQFHDISVGVIINAMKQGDKQNAYKSDITYGTNSEFGFDYLRDNGEVFYSDLVQRGHYFAIIDEVDSILIDEARTPLIISGPVAESKNFYKELMPQVNNLFREQNVLVEAHLNTIRTLSKKENITADEAEDLSMALVLTKRSAPKNKVFAKMMQDPGLKKMTQDYEGILLRDKKMHEADNQLFFVVEEAHKSANLCEKGQALLQQRYPNLFIVEELDEMIRQVNEEDISESEKVAKKEKLSADFYDKSEILHDISQLLKAYALFEKNVDYVINDNKIVIVDPFTGRMMPDRRYSDGLHQALEAKERLTIQAASQTYATITLQNYFKMYEKLAGMTGTAVTEEDEFLEIYKLPVRVIPPNEQRTRVDHEDVIFRTKNDKYAAVIKEIEYWHNLKKPVLVGTISVESSELLSRLLGKRIPHNVLNAKYHEKEAEMVAMAGMPGAVTIATNMAGRGTDIKLAAGVITKNKDEYKDLNKDLTDEFPFGLPLDGLHIIGTERHESRRIDSQLRGRAGRQGDPGTSRFFLSLEDDLLRLFGGDRIAGIMGKLNFDEEQQSKGSRKLSMTGKDIKSSLMTMSIEKAQKRVENYHFEARKDLIKYDEVMNMQREVIYTYRRNVLKGYEIKNDILDMISGRIGNLVEEYIGDTQYIEDHAVDSLIKRLETDLAIRIIMPEIHSDRLNKVILKTSLTDV